ncbi:hypothetical protein H0H93_002289 [Arthromyces matolae]|nr:hypothetical protein H0H93_002289 [Arthromyces matolae]
MLSPQTRIWAPFTDPVTTVTCAHTFCKDCIQRALEHAEYCPIDRSPLCSNNLTPANPIVRSLVDELVVECVHRADGCMHTCQRQLLPSHLAETCEQREVSCPLGKCEDKMKFKDLQGHLHNDNDLIVAEKSTSSIEGETADEITNNNQNEAGVPTESGNETPDTSRRVAVLTAQNTILQHRVHALENLVSTLRREMNAVRHALGPWMQDPNVNSSGYQTTTPSVRIQATTSSTTSRVGHVSEEQQYDASSLHSANPLAAYFPTEHEFTTTYRTPSRQHRTSSSVHLPFQAYDQYPIAPTHPLVAPLNLSTPLEGTLHGLRESVVGLATGMDALGRRQELALSNEATRVGEEMGGLRVGLQGLRMQVCS